MIFVKRWLVTVAVLGLIGASAPASDAQTRGGQSYHGRRPPFDRVRWPA